VPVGGRRWSSVVVAALVVVPLMACQGHDTAASPTAYTAPRQYPDVAAPLGAHERYVYSPYDQTFVLYDTSVPRPVARSSLADFVVYGFSTQEEVYAAGDIRALYFVVIEMVGGCPVTRLRLPVGQAIAPLAADDRMLYFVVSTRGESGPDAARALAVVDRQDWSLRTSPAIDGYIVTGALVGPTLYYVAWTEEAFELRSVDTREAELSSRVVERHMEYPELYAKGGSLLRRVSDDQIAGDGQAWDCPLGWACVFPRTANAVIAMGPDAEGVTHARVFDGETGRLVTDVPDAVGVDAQPGRVTVFGFDTMKTVTVPS